MSTRMGPGTCGMHNCWAPVHFVQAEGEAPNVGRWRHDDPALDPNTETGRGHMPVSVTYEILEDLKCLNGPEDCKGKVEYRMPLSGTGKSFPRCEHHWSERLDQQEGLNRRYPEQPPSDWSPLDAGESWDEEY